MRTLVVTGAGTSEPEFTDPWTLEVFGRWMPAMAAGDLEGSIDAFALFTAGPHRTLDEVSSEVDRRIRAMAHRTMSKHSAGERLLPGTHGVPQHAGVEVMADGSCLQARPSRSERLSHTERF
ncbi:hypothetical protein [Actinoallomurus sp. CA-150999]|uniref:hypothetical protein n=1 Tax=Actinoallomurus sp. CA-150999 TaxID=3239887 RepID=UPI003D8E4422